MLSESGGSLIIRACDVATPLVPNLRIEFSIFNKALNRPAYLKKPSSLLHFYPSTAGEVNALELFTSVYNF